jgi:DMSO/TMAO reductase YedYZ molybdopterin-dependent catalytic subunit
MKKAGLFLYALVGLILTLPLTALFYLAWKVAGLPFVVFDMFDWISKHLPGPVITKAIESMVSVIRIFSLGPTADVAKKAEKTMAVFIFLAGGFVISLVIRLISRWINNPGRWLQILLATAAGIPFLMISLGPQKQLPAGLILSGLWIILLFVLWGWALTLADDRLMKEAEAPEIKGRRQFILRLGGGAAALAVFGTAAGSLIRRKEGVSLTRWSSTNPLPNAGSDVKPVPGTRPEFTSLENHYRIDIDTMPPKISLNSWRLHISGLVKKNIALTMQELMAYPAMNQFVTLECISNYIAGDLISTTRWTGVSLQELLPAFAPDSRATHLKITAADGFTEFLSLEEVHNDQRIMLCYAWDGVPLFHNHGFPLRVYVPDRYGMKQPKWITHIDVTDYSGNGYWVKRGWDREARIRATSVIDTVAVDNIYTDSDGVKKLPTGGIAFAGARGISAVEVRIDEGPWSKAELRTPLSSTTWVIWKYDAPYEKGRHSFTVRCFEGDGTPQISAYSKPHPSGATGLHKVEKEV